DRRRLAGAVGAEEAEHLAGGDGEIDAVQHRGAGSPETAQVGLAELRDFDDGHGETLLDPGRNHRQNTRMRPRMRLHAGRRRFVAGLGGAGLVAAVDRPAFADLRSGSNGDTDAMALDLPQLRY